MVFIKSQINGKKEAGTKPTLEIQESRKFTISKFPGLFSLFSATADAFLWAHVESPTRLSPRSRRIRSEQLKFLRYQVKTVYNFRNKSGHL